MPKVREPGEAARPEPIDRPRAPALWLGYQIWDNSRPPTELYTLTRDIPGHCRESTVSRDTLERAGFYVPPR
jgi:hypothetical protein